MNEPKVSRVIINPVKNLYLKMHIKPTRNKEGRKENFHNIFEFHGEKYMKIDIQSFATLEISDNEWAMDKSILIDQKNLPHIVKGFKQMLKDIYDGGIFAVDRNGKSIIYKDMVDKYTQKIYNINLNQRLLLKPAIVYDENDISYEGVIVFINKTQNYVEMPIDAFETLVSAIEKIDIFAYSQQLLNFYMTVAPKTDTVSEVKSSDNGRRRGPHLNWDASPEPNTITTIPKEQSAMEAMGIDLPN